MLKFKDKAGDTIAVLGDDDTQPKFLKDKKVTAEVPVEQEVEQEDTNAEVE